MGNNTFQRKNLIEDENYKNAIMTRYKGLSSCIIREGYLLKKSAHLGKYRKRWIVLSNQSITAYKDHHKSESPTEIIPLFFLDDVYLDQMKLEKTNNLPTWDYIGPSNGANAMDNSQFLLRKTTLSKIELLNKKVIFQPVGTIPDSVSGKINRRNEELGTMYQNCM